LLTLAKTSPADYEKFWRAFGRVMKEGYNDYRNREKLQELLRFGSSRFSDAQGLVSLAEYVEKMPEGQPAIYYLSGPSREALERDARLELLRKKGIEVLYLDELADEFVLSSLKKYRDKPLVSADQVKPDHLKSVGTDTSESETKTTDQAAADIEPLVARCKEILGTRVSDVRPSQRLVDSPACLVSDDQQLSGHMDKVMRLMNKNADLPQRVLELNPQHTLVKNLAKLVAGDRQDPLVELACEQMFEGSMLVDGYLTDPHKLVERMNRVLQQATELKTAK
jgi:molecular chaperone HtpG